MGSSKDTAESSALALRYAVPLPPALLVPTPRNARSIAIGMSAALVLLAVASLLAPWQQNVRGTGRVIAFAPDQREQPIKATIPGRIERWLVHEGQVVHAGEPVVQLTDNDADIMLRFDTQREAAELRMVNQEDRVGRLRDRVDSIVRSQRAQIATAESEVDIAQQSQISAMRATEAADAELEAAELHLVRQKDLVSQGLVSQREVELATLGARRASAQLESARAALKAAERAFDGRRASLARIRAVSQADIESAHAALREAENDLAASRAILAGLDGDIARQQAGLIVAPRDGIILRIVAQGTGEQVSRGDTLAMLVPDTDDRSVALLVDGNDAALIQKGAPVRLQFEGWPAVQFAGWPSVAVGTFGGRVAFVDASDDGTGNFRVVVMADPDDEPWPAHHYLRQGIRAKGWFLLQQVSLGYEIWRQINGFPPAIQRPADAGGKQAN